jgi:hypothetical protein
MGAGRDDRACGIGDRWLVIAKCHDCGLIAFSAAHWSSIDQCPSCAAPLRPAAATATVTPIWVHPRFRAHARGMDATVEDPSAA